MPIVELTPSLQSWAGDCMVTVRVKGGGEMPDEPIVARAEMLIRSPVSRVFDALNLVRDRFPDGLPKE